MLTVIKITAQVSFIGFDHPTCVSAMTNTYTYSNYSFGSHGYGFNVYRNGVNVLHEDNAGLGPSMCYDLKFINDSVGFIVKSSPASSGPGLFKTKDYGNTWVSMGVSSPGYHGFYVINQNFVYYILWYPPGFTVVRCSDLVPAVNILQDNNFNSDIFKMDTTLNHSLCNIDSLRIFLKNGTDTITYHINDYIPLVCMPVVPNNCAGGAVNVPFEIATAFISGNIFTAELSDASGSFIAPINIGSIFSTNSGTINATIPSSITAGAGYKIRIASSSPPYYSPAFNIHVFDSAPALSLSGTNTVCIGSSVILTGMGALTYSWSNGAMAPSITVTETATTIYTLTGSNPCGASSSTIQVTIDNTCQDVWPGDINNDGVTNNIDFLYLGTNFNHIGPARTSISNSWQPFSCNNWLATQANGENFNHSDCNGDGIINIDDTLAIFNNYNKWYKYVGHSYPYHPQTVRIIADEDTVWKGKWGSASIYVADISNPINSLNGLAFSISFSNNFNNIIETDSMFLEYHSSFLNSINQTIDFFKWDSVYNTLNTAITHTMNANSAGYGKIATLHYKIKDSLTSNQGMYLYVSECYHTDSIGNLYWLNYDGSSTIAINGVVGLHEIAFDDRIFIYPNPTNALLSISGQSIMQNITVTNITGQVLMSEQVNEKNRQLQLQNFAEGIYFVKVLYDNGMSVTKKIIVAH